MQFFVILLDGVCPLHYTYKQLLDEVFVISRIIKVEVGVILPPRNAIVPNYSLI